MSAMAYAERDGAPLPAADPSSMQAMDGVQSYAREVDVAVLNDNPRSRFSLKVVCGVIIGVIILAVVGGVAVCASGVVGAGGGTSSTVTSTTTTATPTSTTTSTLPADVTAANEVNKWFNSDETGVYQRLVPDGVHEPWYGPPSREITSFALVNKFSWDPKMNHVTIYDHFGHSMVLKSGFIANSSVESLVKCSFPCDGDTARRSQGGCGCANQGACASGNYDWCNDFGNKYPNNRNWDANACAYRPNETAAMLRMYKDVKNGKAPGQLETACNAWNQDDSGAWNEVGIDTARWNSGTPDKILAMLMPDECFANADCLNKFTAWYGRFKASHGSKPILYMNRTKHESPYSVLTLAGITRQATQLDAAFRFSFAGSAASNTDKKSGDIFMV